jgi:isoleucyl-tRNA synthetase
MNFEKVNPKQSFPKLEENILNFWQENKIFEESMENRKDSEEFNFYDGPPFATGTPHYGHILAGTLKDVIPRYQTMKWKLVRRNFGWDTHGLPIENIVEKKLWVAWKDDIMKLWIHKFNEECRKNVFWYVDDWKNTVNRMWRWVDMENDYKTMDTSFMESVWWVYKNLYDKGLIYEGHRVVPYCPRCTTPLSNFEVNQWYKDKQDKTLTVKFKVKGNESKYILAWTTTPWTLMANIGLAVWADINYSEIKDTKTSDTYVLASDRLKEYYKINKEWNSEEFTLIKEYKGACLEGIKYEPVFDDFSVQLNDMGSDLWNDVKLGKNAYSVVIGHHVTTESGTWVVHIAPAYWEDDFIIGNESKLGFVSHINDYGKTCNTLNDNGKYVFDYNDEVIETLKQRWDIVKISTIDHSYPHCWRCDTPLIYRGISAWYVAVEKIRDKMVDNNQDINWTPEVIKNGRFGKWVENARDWNISRNRYWGSAIPVWQSEDKSEEVCIGSVKEMYELNKEYGQIEEKDWKYTYTATGDEVDIHKHFVDEILLKHPETGTKLTRIPEVLDCWFESGSMPYASKHYPFENSDNFKFPADFIAEWLDQTRGWFYTLLILGTALFDKAPMKNVIVNGIVLAEDGKKMSKSLNNYPDPKIVFDKYGADAMRFYLMNSPVVEAQDFRFVEAWVEEVVKKVILPLWNTYYFFTTYANIDNFKATGSKTRNNNLDKWLISELNELTKEVSDGFDAYKLNDATKPIVKFMDNLTNWYIRRSRKRFWKSENDGDKLEAYETLYTALVELTKIIAPFMPFISEHMYKELTGKKSVHLTDFPKYDINLIDEKLNYDTDMVQKVITLGLAWRANQKIRVRQPLQSITITETLDDYNIEIIKEELNVKEVLVVDWNTLAKQICKPNCRAIWPKFGKDVKFIMWEAKSGNFTILDNWNAKVWEFELEQWDFELVFETWDTWTLIETGFWMVIAMDNNITEELKLEWYARDIVRQIQEARKEADYQVDDRINIYLNNADNILNIFKEYIQTETLSTITKDIVNPDIEKSIELEDLKINLKLKK